MQAYELRYSANYGFIFKDICDKTHLKEACEIFEHIKRNSSASPFYFTVNFSSKSAPLFEPEEVYKIERLYSAYSPAKDYYSESTHNFIHNLFLIFRQGFEAIEGCYSKMSTIENPGRIAETFVNMKGLNGYTLSHHFYFLYFLRLSRCDEKLIDFNVRDIIKRDLQLMWREHQQDKEMHDLWYERLAFISLACPKCLTKDDICKILSAQRPDGSWTGTREEDRHRSKIFHTTLLALWALTNATHPHAK